MNSNHQPICEGEMSTLRYYRQLATTPALSQNRDGDAGYDLFTPNEALVWPGVVCVINTELHVAIPRGYVGFLKGRSGLAMKHGIDVLGGVIDSNYRGPIKVLLTKTGRGTKDISPAVCATLKAGDAVAQLVIVPCVHLPTRQVELQELGVTERGDAGFGSSGR